MLSLHFYKFRSEGCSTFYTYEQNPDKAFVYQQNQINFLFLPIFLKFTNSVHKKLSNKMKTHRQSIVSHTGLLHI